MSEEGNTSKKNKRVETSSETADLSIKDLI